MPIYSHLRDPTFTVETLQLSLSPSLPPSPSMAYFNRNPPSSSLSSTESIADQTRQADSVSGEIHVIVGPMFAGKTTSLLRRIKAEVTRGRTVAIIKSSKDNRYAADSVVTHDGMKFPCWALPDLSSFRQRFGSSAYEKLDVIGIDEAQFFNDLYDFCCMAAEKDRKTVIVAGLDGDYLRRSFGSVLDIIPLADSVTKLTARCDLCGRKAFFTFRKTEETQTELIGGADIYMPVCRQHYVNGQIDAEATGILMKSVTVKGDLLLEENSEV